MANKEQVIMLRRSVSIWNEWRNENPDIEVDLSGANLVRANLTGADLTSANLREANLRGANLRTANLRGADLMLANLKEARLVEANLNGARLLEANLKEIDLSEANLIEASLYGVRLSAANLSSANLSNAELGSTVFSELDLSEAYGLETIKHLSPSTIGTDTIKLSKGEIPEVFLQGCGLSDLDIEYTKLYKPDLSNEEINRIIYKIFDLRASQAIQISPLFISYSHADTQFVEKLETNLLEKGIRFWRDVHNATVGPLEKQIDYAMRQNPTVLLILSKNSTASDWVEHEARLARELQKEIGRDVLCPIALDDSWKSAKWPARLMEQIKEYNILDFSKWRNDTAFEQVLNKMINGLDMFYKK